MKKLTVLIITKNAEETIEKCLTSVHSFASEIVVVDDFSDDMTIKIAKGFTDKVYSKHQQSLGKQRDFALSKAKNNWVLFLDSDETVSNELRKEITSLLSKSKIQFNGYIIPYQNHFLGRKINFGGENYKILRLFNKNTVQSVSPLIHEGFKVDGEIGILKNKIYHYSYRSLSQMYYKFTRYAYLQAYKNKLEGGKTSFRKILLYAPHMFWARFIKDKGYKDGFFRVPLDLGFAYMEFLTYVLMLFPLKTKKP